MDREYAKPLDGPAMVNAAPKSRSHFSREFRAALALLALLASGCRGQAVRPEAAARIDATHLPDAGPPKRRIDLRLVNTPIRKVAEMFSDFSDVPVVVDEDVRVNVNQEQLRDVPWDLALEQIARSHGLRLIRTDQNIRIAKQSSTP